MPTTRPHDASLPPLVSTGIDGLDIVLNGGLPKERVYLVEGDPGSGKTTLGLQFLTAGHRRGEQGLYVTLSETAHELRVVAASHGLDISGIAVYELAPLDASLLPEDQYTVFHPSEVELGETTRAIMSEVERLRPSRVVFDSLSELRLLARDPLRYRRQILALKQLFVGKGATVLLLDDRTSGDGDHHLQSLAHGVIRLEQMSPEYGGERRRLRVMKLRGVAYRGGYHDFVITTGGLEVFPRSIPPSGVAPSRTLVLSGVPELDTLLGGGLECGTTALLLGPAGAGKSAIGTQYLLAAARRGEKSAVYLFDEGTQTYLWRAQGVSSDLQPHVAAGLISINPIDPASLSPGEFTHRVKMAVERDGVQIVVIDSLNGYFNAMSEERMLLLQIHELFTFLRQKGVLTIVLVAQHGLAGATMQSPVDLSYLADTVIVLRYFEASGAIRQALSVIKKRSGAHERTIREFKLDSQGVRVGEPLAEFHGVLTGVPTYTGGLAPLLPSKE